MGTRADFYIGRGDKARWIGSIAMDGYPEGIPTEIFEISNQTEFELVVKGFIVGKEHGTLPKSGWSWPWDDSRLTDYSYALDEGKVWASCFGNKWFDPTQQEIEYEEVEENEKEIFPNMTKMRTRTLRKWLMI